MSNQTGQENIVFELFIRFAYVLVILVNVLIVAGIGALWKSFRNFKEDIKEMIRTFVSGNESHKEEVKGHIATLYERERNDRDLIMENKRGLEDHVRQCEQKSSNYNRN